MITKNIHDSGVLNIGAHTNSGRNSTRNNSANSRKQSTNAQEFLRRIGMLKKGGSKTLKKRSKKRKA